MKETVWFKQCEEIENTKQPNLDTPTAQSTSGVVRGCFLEREYGKVTLHQIVEWVGVTSGLTVYYSKSRDRLVARITAEYLEERIQKMDLLIMNGLDSVERFYTVTFLDRLIIDENPDFVRFYYSYNRSTPGLYWENGNTYTRLTHELFDEYRLDVSERQNEIYLIACRGNTRELLLHRHKHPHLIIRETVTGVTTSDYFCNFGASDKVIYRVIQSSKIFLGRHYPYVFQEES